ncbi:hypothetical protein DEU56DRAFT_759897 [Suillus clintonianus]|uniref:uncharacterized protein n=1 Tax=Suillus clintonianus TaxID=1904413 RepID=UPI001B87FCFC|nr:uncharacterized protein DEU56DRAFT_759897 [Suillus clintonianus]KAG2123868.1 hypothetical protein DEU56DRAFT_759897 [Suillus clintonianus]
MFQGWGLPGMRTMYEALLILRGPTAAALSLYHASVSSKVPRMQVLSDNEATMHQLGWRSMRCLFSTLQSCESDGSGSSDSSDDSDHVVLLDEKPSDWVEPPAKRRKLSVSKMGQLEDEIRDLEKHLERTEELRLRAELECKKIKDQLELLRACRAV